MSQIKFYKVTTLPASLEADAFYYVVNGGFAEAYLTDSLSNAKALGNTVMTQSVVDSALASWSGQASMIEIVANIAARDVLIAASDRNLMLLVIDASADATVTSGSALYAYSKAGAVTYKISEYESMDVTLEWAAIQNGPTSTVSQIDDAVSKAHQHSNLTTLNKIGEASGSLTFGGAAVNSNWATQDW